MFKKSIPLMLGALLLGTNVKAVDISCPPTVPEPNKISDGTFFWYLDPDTAISALTFDDASTITVKAKKSIIQCRYKDAEGEERVLETWTPQKCIVVDSANVKGKQTNVGEPLSTCSGSPSCGNIKCGPF